MRCYFPWLEPQPPKPPPKPRPPDEEIIDALVREDWDWFPAHKVHNDAVFAALARAIRGTGAEESAPPVRRGAS